MYAWEEELYCVIAINIVFVLFQSTNKGSHLCKATWIQCSCCMTAPCWALPLNYIYMYLYYQKNYIFYLVINGCSCCNVWLFFLFWGVFFGFVLFWVFFFFCHIIHTVSINGLLFYFYPYIISQISLITSHSLVWFIVKFLSVSERLIGYHVV